MGLGQLLSVGKTFRPAGNQPNRFRSVPRWKLAGAGSPATMPHREETMKSKPPSPTGGVVPESPAGAPAEQPRGGARLAAAWWNPLAWLASRAEGSRAVRALKPSPSKLRQAVQEELALGDVKPCCNSLAEADWELAPGALAAPKPGLFHWRTKTAGEPAGLAGAPGRADPVARV
jgi:hypothetical protein